MNVWRMFWLHSCHGDVRNINNHKNLVSESLLTMHWVLFSLFLKHCYQGYTLQRSEASSMNAPSGKCILQRGSLNLSIWQLTDDTKGRVHSLQVTLNLPVRQGAIFISGTLPWECVCVPTNLTNYTWAVVFSNKVLLPLWFHNSIVALCCFIHQISTYHCWA